MTEQEYHQAVAAVVTCAAMLAQHDLPGLLQAIERADAFGPIFDPTLWTRKQRAMMEDKTAFEAALPLWRIGRALSGENRG